jgi:hypothetical protein
MTYTSQYNWGPENTPSIILRLIIITLVVSLFCALTNSIISSFFNVLGPQELLSLSWYGLFHYYFWQPFTFLFVQDGGSQGINLWYLISLAFNMYILWAFGSQLVQQFSAKSFLGLYFGSGLFGAFIALLTMLLVGRYDFLAGPTPSILALITAWTMINLDVEILLFMLIPLKAKWMLAGILGIIVLIDISHLNFVDLAFNLGGALFGYFYALLAWDIPGPFSWMHTLDRRIHRFAAKISQKFRKQSAKKEKKSKVIDLSTGKTTSNDDEFVDEMLAKIARQGEKSLTWQERKRMQEISAKKMRDRES